MNTKERPILFSAPMVRAILDGRKTQTRRAFNASTLKLMKLAADAGEVSYFASEGCLNKNDQEYVASFCPYGKPGDRLWVRETWQHSNFPLGPYDDSCTVFYRADYLDDPHGPDGEKSAEGKYRTWIPSIHMYRSASRILLEVADVRVERLQEMEGQTAFESDALKEGINSIHHGDGDYYYSAFRSEPDPHNWGDPFDAFRELWESINGADSWAANPWVWVVEFKRVQA